MRRGYSMVELLFALLILQVGILASAGMVFLAQENLRRAELLGRGLVETQRIGDSLSALAGGGAGTVSYPWGDVVWAPSEAFPGGWMVEAVSDVTGDTLVSIPVLPRLPRKPLGLGCGLGGPVRVEAP